MPQRPPFIPDRSPPPLPQKTGEPQKPAAPLGYVSEESRRKYHMAAAIWSGVFAAGSFIIPMIVGMVVFAGAFFSQMSNMSFTDPDRAAFWDGRVWYLENQVSAFHSDRQKTLLRWIPWPFADQKADEETLPVTDAWLLAGDDRLWIVSDKKVGYFRDGQVSFTGEENELYGFSRPFTLMGNPALIVEGADFEYELLQLQDGQRRSTASFSLIPDDFLYIEEDVQVLADGADILLFVKDGGNLYFHRGWPEEGEGRLSEWTLVAETWRAWQAAMIGGRPVVFYGTDQGGKTRLVASRFVDGKWDKSVVYDQLLDANLGVLPLTGNRFLILAQSLPGSFRLVLFENFQPVKTVRFGQSMFFSAKTMYAWIVPQWGVAVFPFILAFILTGLMGKYRITAYEYETRRIPYATLNRRGMALLIDAVIFGWPGVIVSIKMVSAFSDMEEILISGPVGMFAHLGAWVLAGLAWGFLCFLVFSFMEGRWGLTLGKWALGIRVVGLDLKPCGFGRALLRNLLRIADGFFYFLVGIMAVAFTEKWQRLGDMLAKTVVVKSGNP